jgi:hypothetical protein
MKKQEEGMLDYFNIEQYLQTLPTSVGRYVRFRPAASGGDGYMTVSQIQVIDMNGNNIAKGAAVSATATSSGSANVSIVIDGTASDRKGAANVWTGGGNRSTDYLQIDLGSVQQIAQIIYIGQADATAATALRTKDMICQILDVNFNVTTTQNFLSSDLRQTLNLPNSINITPTPSGATAGLMNPLLMPLNAAQPEVFLLNGTYTKSQAAAACSLIGATVATQGQLTDAYNNGAQWSNPGWTTDGNDAYYPSASGVQTTVAGTLPNADSGQMAITNGTRAISTATTNVNCFGVKPAQGVNSSVQPFNSSGWTQYVGNSKPVFFGATTISVPDIQKLYAYVIPKWGGASANLQTPEAWWTAIADLSGSPLYSALETTAPWNFLYDEASTPVSTITGLNSTIQIFGTVSAAAIADMNSSMDLCKKIFLGATNDVDKFINIAYNDLNPYIRTNTGWTNFCTTEIVQTVSAGSGDYVINLVPAKQTSNQTKCNTPLTTDMLGLLPNPARNFIVNWVYNRKQRMIQFKSSTDPNLQTILNGVAYMKMTVGGAPIPIDVTNTFTLDTIAQSFYEAMGGNYIMSQIYDVFSIGGTILDVRFDMTKHADISALQANVAALKAKYYAIRASNVSQDILDAAKQNYQSALLDLQATESANTLPPVSGMVGRFFYNYSPATISVNITGFTLDARAVTSFIPELNCGIQVATGSAAGELNYTPNIVYTKNVPETLVCTDPTTLRRIFDDYVDLTQTDLAGTLLGNLNADGQTYTGPAGGPSMDTTLGTVHINQILGAVQVSPTQCAVKWTETLWNDLSNQPVNTAVTNVTRRALFSYTVDTADWYASDLTIDASGFMFYSADTVPACTFSPTYYQKQVSPRLDTLNPSTAADILTLQNDFLANAWTNGQGPVCPSIIPNYIFNSADYCAANSDLNGTFNNSGKGPLNVAGAQNHYSATASDGLRGGRTVRTAQAIPALATVITIPQPIPANNTLDDGGGACPATTCEDLNVLFSLADQYNQDPTQPGTILRITRAMTAGDNQCDLELDINYDVMTQDTKGVTVKKGSFTINEAGAQVANTATLPTGLKKGETRAFTIERQLADCSFILNSVDGPGSGLTIQSNTPALYKPMHYATQFQEANNSIISTSLGNLASVIADAAAAATSVLTTYREQTTAAVGNLATLGTDCTAKCSDTAILNSMLEYYKTQNLHKKQINTVLRVGTLNSTTCDITFQEDTLASTATIRSAEYQKSTTRDISLILNTTNKTVLIKSTFGYNPAAITYTMPDARSFTFGWPNHTDWGTALFTLQNDGSLLEGSDPTKWTPTTTTATTYSVASSTTSGLRFTMAPGSAACTFSPTAMTSVLPAPPPSIATNMAGKPSSAICEEVYAIGGYSYTQATAQAKCESYGGTLASMAQLTAGQVAGASWCSTGWLSDMSGNAYYPINGATVSGCAGPGINPYVPPSGLAGANCYGVKPKQGLYSDVLAFTGTTWNQPNACAASALNYVNPGKEAFQNYGPPVQVSESTFPLDKPSFGLDMARNKGGPRLESMYVEPLRAEVASDMYSPVDSVDAIRPAKATAYKYLRFRPVKTRYPMNPTVDVGKFRFLLGKNEIDMKNAKVSNPMGSWVGDMEDVIGVGFKRGWADVNKRPLVFAFPYAVLVDGFTWTTAHPDKGLGGDPVQWKLEGSQNGVYWTILRDQTKHNFAVPHARFQELPVFRF